MLKWDRPAVSHDYPPDAYFEERVGVQFTWLFVATVLVAGIVDVLVFGVPETGIPYNYALPVGVLYLIVAVFTLRRFHSILDTAKHEVLSVVERTDLENGPDWRGSDTTPGKIAERSDEVLDRAFRTQNVLGGALLGGAFAVGLMWYLGAFQYYPYVLTAFLYGAGHGLFYAPIVGTVWLIKLTATEFIVDIDVLAPDGMGGYKRVGDGIVNLVVLGIVLATLDFLVLSSVTFVDEPAFQAAALLLYAGMIVTLLVVALGGSLALRHRMLEIRDRRIGRLRREFSNVEDRYYRKLADGEEPEPESEHMETMLRIFEEIDGMDMWPINPGALLRLSSATAGSVIVADIQTGVVTDPTFEIALHLL